MSQNSRYSGGVYASGAWCIFATDRNISINNSNDAGSYSARPVIEVAKNKIAIG